MAKQQGWLSIFIALLLVSSIVGHYVGDIVADVDVAEMVDSAETHPLHNSGLASPSTQTTQPTTIYGAVTPHTILVQSHAQPPLLRPPIIA